MARSFTREPQYFVCFFYDREEETTLKRTVFNLVTYNIKMPNQAFIVVTYKTDRSTVARNCTFYHRNLLKIQHCLDIQ